MLRHPGFFFPGVCAVFSVVPAHRASTVSGRTTTHIAALVPASLPVQYAEKTSWKKSCCCSVSTVIGEYRTLKTMRHCSL